MVGVFLSGRKAQKNGRNSLFVGSANDAGWLGILVFDSSIDVGTIFQLVH